MSDIEYSTEFFNKGKMLKDLIEFEQTAASINASSEYLDGVNAVINRIKLKEPDFKFKFSPTKRRKE